MKTIRRHSNQSPKRERGPCQSPERQRRVGVLAALAVALCLSALPIIARSTSDGSPSQGSSAGPPSPALHGADTSAAPAAPDASPTDGALEQRQRVIRDRMQRLESSMLMLSRLLAESEPAKAERLRDALEYCGSHQIKARVARLTELLEAGQLSEAEQQQESLLTDLDALLTLLKSSVNEVERRRAERQRLEALKQTIRALLDEQMQILYRTQRVPDQSPERQRGVDSDQSRGRQRAAPDAAGSPELAEMLRQLEQLQRLAQRKTADLQRDMQKRDAQKPALPGVPQVGQAAEEMQQAADALGERQPAAAEQSQEGALQQLQEALDELDDALRQVRREESEETLAALETRFRSMLTREQGVRATLRELDQKRAENWTRVNELQLTESAEIQRGVTQDCQTTLRMLIDEGSTVIVPELVRQMADDMAEVATRLAQADTSPQTQAMLDDIVALLEDVLGAIEQKREADMRLEQQQQPSETQPRPLLPGSAELKLLRCFQVRLNERAQELAASETAPDDESAREVERLAQRQRHLADLARRMNERQ